MNDVGSAARMVLRQRWHSGSQTRWPSFKLHISTSILYILVKCVHLWVGAYSECACMCAGMWGASLVWSNYCATTACHCVRSALMGNGVLNPYVVDYFAFEAQRKCHIDTNQFYINEWLATFFLIHEMCNCCNGVCDLTCLAQLRQSENLHLHELQQSETYYYFPLFCSVIFACLHLKWVATAKPNDKGACAQQT